jgi:hypothetical protein
MTEMERGRYRNVILVQATVSESIEEEGRGGHDAERRYAPTDAREYWW